MLIMLCYNSWHSVGTIHNIRENIYNEICSIKLTLPELLKYEYKIKQFNNLYAVLIYGNYDEILMKRCNYIASLPKLRIIKNIHNPQIPSYDAPFVPMHYLKYEHYLLVLNLNVINKSVFHNIKVIHITHHFYKHHLINCLNKITSLILSTHAIDNSTEAFLNLSFNLKSIVVKKSLVGKIHISKVPYGCYIIWVI